MIPGRFCMSITDAEKGDGYDADVIVNQGMVHISYISQMNNIFLIKFI